MASAFSHEAKSFAHEFSLMFDLKAEVRHTQVRERQGLEQSFNGSASSE